MLLIMFIGKIIYKRVIFVLNLLLMNIILFFKNYVYLNVIYFIGYKKF